MDTKWRDFFLPHLEYPRHLHDYRPGALRNSHRRLPPWENPLGVPRAVMKALAWQRLPFDKAVYQDELVAYLEKTKSPKKMIVLEQADHMHFCDQVEQVHELFRMMPPPVFDQVAKDIKPIAELCAGDPAYRFTRGLGLAHMDAHLRGDEGAKSFLDGDLVGLLAAEGVVARLA